MKKVTPSNYKKDKLYCPVARAVHEIMQADHVVRPVEVLMRMQRLSKQDYEDWRFARIPYLERVLVGNLSKLNRILRILRIHAESMGLVASHTEYRKWGKGKKRIVLRFSKSRDPKIEKAYSTHYVARGERKRQADAQPGVGNGSTSPSDRERKAANDLFLR
ncbi:MAG: hypothetical protein ACQESR_22810 [Planctomycetota bacterium]